MIRLLIFGLLAASALAQGLLQQAEQAFHDGDLNRAASLASQLLARSPNVAFAHLILGVVAARRSDYVTSSKHFRTVIRLEPANPHGYFYLGQAKLYEQQWDAAISYFRQAVKRGYPDRERLMIELALAQNEAGRPTEALDTLAGIAAPADGRLTAQYYSVTAFSKAKLNQTAEAVDFIRRALDLDDSNAHHWEFLIGCLFRLDRTPQALAEAIRAQRKFPDHPDIQFLFALASYYVPESPLGKLALRNVDEAEPGSARVVLARGLLYRKEGKNDEAIAAFREAAGRGVPDARLLLGIVYKENGDYAAAEREYREAERINPQNGQILLEIGKLLVANGDLAGARNRLEKAAELMPDAPAVHYQLGLLYRRIGEPEKAERHFQRSKQP